MSRLKLVLVLAVALTVLLLPAGKAPACPGGQGFSHACEPLNDAWVKAPPPGKNGIETALSNV